MILDLAKLFPKACAAKGVQSLHMSIYDIEHFERRTVRPAGFTAVEHQEDIVQTKESLYRFPALDDGIKTLQEITTNLNVIRHWDGAKETFEANSESFLDAKKKRDDALKLLGECTAKFG